MDEIDMAMGKISDFYGDKLETILNGLTSLLEALLMAFLGVVIVGIVLCMFLPIFKMVELVLADKKADNTYRFQYFTDKQMHIKVPLRRPIMSAYYGTSVTC